MLAELFGGRSRRIAKPAWVWSRNPDVAMAGRDLSAPVLAAGIPDWARFELLLIESGRFSHHAAGVGGCDLLLEVGEALAERQAL